MLKQFKNLNENREVDKAQATKFLLPLISPFQGSCWDLMRDGFENCYLYNDSKLIIVYRVTEDIKDLDEKFKSNESYIESKDVGDNKVGYLFNIPEKHIEDVKLFKEGKYSQLSEDAKQAVLSGWDVLDDNNPLYGVLYLMDAGKRYNQEEVGEDSEVAEGEYWKKPDLSKEYFSSYYQEDIVG